MRAGAEETRGAVAWWRGREQERGEKEQKAGESARERVMAGLYM